VHSKSECRKLLPGSFHANLPDGRRGSLLDFFFIWYTPYKKNPKILSFIPFPGKAIWNLRRDSEKYWRSIFFHVKCPLNLNHTPYNTCLFATRYEWTSLVQDDSSTVPDSSMLEGPQGELSVTKSHILNVVKYYWGSFKFLNFVLLYLQTQ